MANGALRSGALARLQVKFENRIKEICQTRVRYGYRRYASYCAAKDSASTVNRACNYVTKAPRRRVKAKLRDDRKDAPQPNETFAHDRLATGKKLRVLTVIDIFSRYSPIIDPRFSYHGENVAQSLEWPCAQISYTKTIRVEQARSSSRATSTCGLKRTA